MKKVIALILALTLALGAAACAGGETPANTPDAPSNTETGTPADPATTEPEAEPVAGVDFTVWSGEPDYTGLAHLDAIAAYEKSDWTAEWIWTRASVEDSWVVLRKTFDLAADTDATAYIASVDKYVLFVNGEPVQLDGCLKRGPSPLDTYYDELNLSLKAGRNVIAALVAFNGRSGDGSIVPTALNSEGDEYTQAGFLFEMDAAGTKIASDASWKATRHDGYKNRISGGKEYVRYDQSSMLAERNVWYNAADSIGDFASADFDDSGWENAYRIAAAGDIPFGKLYASIIDPPVSGELVDFAGVPSGALAEDTTLTLDLPGNIQFTWYVELTAPAGKHLTVYTDTYTDRDNLPNFKDTYVTAEGAQSYENWPWRSGSRLIIEAEAGVELTRVAYRPSGAAAEKAGSFTSSDAALDQLWQESLNTVIICMRDTYMDCPERERGPYMGDASNQIDAALYGLDEGGLEMTKKAILACIAWTTDSGAIPSRAPSVKPQEIPNQSLAFMTSAYHYWLHSGDRETMTAYYGVFLDYLRLFEMKDGLPVYRPGSWQWNDWGNRIDSDLLQTGFYYYALATADKLAADLGISEGRDFLAERMADIEANWRDAFYTEEGFRSAGSKYVDERGNALLALSGLAGEEDWELITKVIMSTYEASPFTEKYILEALCVMGRTDLALERIRIRYAPMLTDRWDTLWEQFNDNVGTYNHGWSAAPMYILSRYAAGIAPTSGGWETWELSPSDALESFECTEWTPKGEISVKKDGNKLTVKAVPGGTLVLNGERTELPEGESEWEIN